MINPRKAVIPLSLLILTLSGCQTVTTTPNSDYDDISRMEVPVEQGTVSIATPAVDLKNPAVKVTANAVKEKSKKSTKANAAVSTSSKKKVKPAVIQAKVTSPKIETTKALVVKPSPVIIKPLESVETDLVTNVIEKQATTSADLVKSGSDVAVSDLKNDMKGASITVIETVQQQADDMDRSVKEAGVPEIAVLVPAAPISDFSLEQLPMSFNQWSLDIIGANTCMLTSKPIPIQDGQGGTKIVAEITDGALVLKTRSVIDDSYKNTGIQINSNQQLPIERLHSESAIIYSEQYDNIMTTMKQEGTLTVSLGFWPTWPVTQAYQASINLNGFNQAFQALQHCRQELSKK